MPNGELGEVVRFQRSDDGLVAWAPVVRWHDGRVSLVAAQELANGGVTRVQLPVQLAWAMTFHKAASPQGPAHFDDGRPTPNSDCKIRVFAGRDPGLFLKTMSV